MPSRLYNSRAEVAGRWSLPSGRKFLTSSVSAWVQSALCQSASNGGVTEVKPTRYWGRSTEVSTSVGFDFSSTDGLFIPNCSSGASLSRRLRFQEKVVDTREPNKNKNSFSQIPGRYTAQDEMAQPDGGIKRHRQQYGVNPGKLPQQSDLAVANQAEDAAHRDHYLQISHNLSLAP